MSSPYVILGNRPLDQWKVTELKEELKKRKLTTRGLKDDLIKRLDEAVRAELQNSTNASDDDDDQSNIPSEQTKGELFVPNEANDSTDTEMKTGEKAAATTDNQDNHNTDSCSDDKVVEVDLVHEVPGMEVTVGHFAAVKTTVMINEAVEPANTINESHVENGGFRKDEDTPAIPDAGILPTLDEDPLVNSADHVKQSSEIDPSSIPENLSAGPNLSVSKTQNEDNMNSASQKESGAAKSSLSDSTLKPLKCPVSDVDPNPGFPTPSDSVSTELNSFVKKDELIADAISDNIESELDAREPFDRKNSNDAVENQDVKEPIQKIESADALDREDVTELFSAEPSVQMTDGSNIDNISDVKSIDMGDLGSEKSDVKKDELIADAIPDNIKSELDVSEPFDRKDNNDLVENEDLKEPIQKIESADALDQENATELFSAEPSMQMTDGSNIDSISDVKSIDIGVLGSEKLNLDRSPGDDSEEEDVPEVKQLDFKPESNRTVENAEKSLLPTPMEDDHVDVVGHSNSIESEPIDVEKMASSESASVKRKLHDKEVTANHDLVKKARKWNTVSSKSSEPQSGLAHKGLPEPSVKRAVPAVSEEQAKERVVPPSSKPPTNSLRIDRFLRPFTLKAVQELLGRSGSITSFWMDHIKTHCYISYSTVEEAEKTRNAVYNLQWPPNGGRLLVAEFVDPQEVKAHVDPPVASPATNTTLNFTVQPQPSGQSQQTPHLPVQRQLPPREQPLPARDRFTLPPPPPPPPPALPEKVDPPMVTLDDLFRKTRSTPRIYYMPLSDEEVAAKLQKPRKNVNQSAGRMLKLRGAAGAVTVSSLCFGGSLQTVGEFMLGLLSICWCLVSRIVSEVNCVHIGRYRLFFPWMGRLSRLFLLYSIFNTSVC